MDELGRPEPHEAGYETYYETEARPRIVRRLRRLCNEFGWEVVLVSSRTIYRNIDVSVSLKNERGSASGRKSGPQGRTPSHANEMGSPS
jgi:hypothetical protein